MNIHYHRTDEDRKALVSTISEILGQPSVYLGAPTFAYKVGDYQISKDGEVTNPDETSYREFMELVGQLELRGITAKQPPIMDCCCISIPDEGVTEEVFQKLLKIIASKANLLKKAIGTECLEVGREDGKLTFPWFPVTDQLGEGDAYMRLVCAMVKMAKEQTRVTATEKPVENEKYAMRQLLIRLGFIGDEYKSARKILLKNLSGNSSWKSGKRPEPAAVPPLPEEDADNHNPEKPWDDKGGTPDEQ